jgi:hypothetical protein
MKKILITGPFEGAVQLLYGVPGIGADAWPPLLNVDFSGAVLKHESKAWLMGRIPIVYGPVLMGEGENAREVGFEQAFTTKLKVVVADAVLDFDEDFWHPYDKKRNRDRSLIQWNKLAVAERGLAVARLGAYLRYVQRTGIAKADPENYLKKKYFKDDYDNL